MKRLRFLPLLLMILLLSACAARGASADPVLQTELLNTGVALRVYGTALQTGELSYWPEQGGEPVTLPALYAGEAAPTLEWDAPKSRINLAFAVPTDGGLTAYQQPYAPVEDVDVVFEAAGDGVTRCRFDTIYSYLITVTGENGSDQFLLLCARDGYGVEAPQTDGEAAQTP